MTGEYVVDELLKPYFNGNISIHFHFIDILFGILQNKILREYCIKEKLKILQMS